MSTPVNLRHCQACGTTVAPRYWRVHVASPTHAAREAALRAEQAALRDLSARLRARKRERS